ncbi:MAG: hypothetical protein ACYDEB_08395 [Dehalococcoidia bacterium]
MSEARPPLPRGCTWRTGCLLPLLAVAAVIVLVVAGEFVAFLLGSQSSTNPAATFDAGAAEAYRRGDVSQIEQEHLYITRLEDGTFIALYDKSPRQQEGNGSCRVHYVDQSPLGTLPQLPGFTGAFVEDCNAETRTVWRADGTYAFGAGYGNLDRYGTRINADGHLIVDLRSRTCTRSRGAVGVPPFDVTRCGRGS